MVVVALLSAYWKLLRDVKTGFGHDGEMEYTVVCMTTARVHTDTETI